MIGMEFDRRKEENDPRKEVVVFPRKAALTAEPRWLQMPWRAAESHVDLASLGLSSLMP